MQAFLSKNSDYNKSERRTFKSQLDLALYLSYLEARKGGKRRTHDEHDFEINLFANLQSLSKDILDKTYYPLRSTAHIITKPVIREIFAAPFRDRIVHHLLFGSVYDWWDGHFVYDSYSCRLDKGVLFGIRRLDHHIRSASENYKYRVYVCKLDIQGYFMSLPRRELYQRAVWGLNLQYRNKKHTREYDILKFLWQRTIMDDPVKGARKKGDLDAWTYLPTSKSLFNQPSGQGIVIGNLTSQLLSNIYLDQLDRFVTLELGYKHYGRYVDDFFIVVKEEQLRQLKNDIRVIEEYLRLIGLTLHPRKRLLKESKYGIPFLGATVYHDHIVPGERLVKNAKRAMKEVVSGKRTIDSVPSYMGHFKYFNSYSILKQIFTETGWDYASDDLLRTAFQKTRKSPLSDDFLFPYFD